MNSQRREQIRLATFGFDARTEESFRLTFKGPGKGKALLVEESAADFGIINLDAVDSKKYIDEYSRCFPGRSVIKFSIKEPEKYDALYVKKPAKIDDVLLAIDKLIEELEILQSEESKSSPHAFQEIKKSSNNSDSVSTVSESKTKLNNEIQITKSFKEFPIKNAASEKQKTSLYYNPKDYLQSEIHSAVEFSNTRGLAVELWVMYGDDQWRKFVFHPQLQKVLTSLTDKELQVCCTSPLSLVNHKLYRHNEKETAKIQELVNNDNRSISYDAFLWKVALFTSQGRLPEGTNLKTAVQLKQWPNLTRLTPVDGGMRIAKLLVDQPRELPLVAKVLNMPASRVYAFYSAACAIGLVDESGEYVDLMTPSMPERHKHHTLFGRILRRLKGNSDPNIEMYA